MSIDINVTGVDKEPKYPLIRRWVGSATAEAKDGLVVIFVNSDEGFAICGVPFSDLGRMQQWVPHKSDDWAKCAITLTSDN